MEQFDKAIKLDPSSATAYTNKGFLLLNELRDLEAAKRLFEKAIEVDPSGIEVCSVVVGVCGRVGLCVCACVSVCVGMGISASRSEGDRGRPLRYGSVRGWVCGCVSVCACMRCTRGLAALQLGKLLHTDARSCPYIRTHTKQARTHAHAHACIHTHICTRPRTHRRTATLPLCTLRTATLMRPSSATTAPSSSLSSSRCVCVCPRALCARCGKISGCFEQINTGAHTVLAQA